jgi:2-polyprenyl-6-methoxyphenol hydroxylase-like FAD-dependent oxidoreductase
MRIVVIGGSVAGLVLGLMAASRGHEVTILEADPYAVPDSVEDWLGWKRPLAPQVHHSHAFLALGRNLLRDHLPAAHVAVLDAGAVEHRVIEYLPPTIADQTPQPGDEEIVAIASRRTTYDWALRRLAETVPGLRCRYGVRVADLQVGERGGVHHVEGVCARGGELIAADVVVDATGKATRVPRYLAARGVTLPEEQAYTETINYSRWYRTRPGETLPRLIRGAVQVSPQDTFVCLGFLADAGVCNVTLMRHAEDRELKAFADENVFTAVSQLFPFATRMIDPDTMTPISDVMSMSNGYNVARHYVQDSRPLVTGVHAIGDALCTTNTVYGYGVTLAVAHAIRLVDALEAGTDADATLAWHDVFQREFAPFFHVAVHTDAARLAAWRSTLGLEVRPGAAAGPVDPGAAAAAASLDGTVWRGMVRAGHMLDNPASFWGSQEMADRIRVTLATGTPPPMPPPIRRADLLEVLASVPQATG